ncbi:hypothetical protein [Thioalkalivibrio sp. ALMg11]|uniref:hypothetical protein n=1 Tax=Thioalkalivibrio sp. ALMg11 TaxID=1158165 RepID=UPI0003746C8F|nr:hypothetical protein [Thioalkalivibrio sp. ALMg11]
MSTPFERYTNIALSQLGLPAGSEVYAASAEVEWYEDGWEHELEDEGIDPDELMSLSEAVELVRERALVSIPLPPGQMLVRARDPEGKDHAGVVTLVDDWQPAGPLVGRAS